MDDLGHSKMNLDDIQDLAAGGFIGFKTVADLRSDCSCLPKTKGLIVYIGKAGGGGTKATLHSRLRQYLRFGQGKEVGHWGGRFIWQLKDASSLIVCWKPLPDDEPEVVESSLIRQFSKAFGQRPFANLKD